ncbi:MAG TPA: hypothetical protein VF813_09490, partial [Anaerolineaceae bacterium]
SGAEQVLFQAEPQALISSALLSPDGKQLLLAYAPPPTAQNQLVYTALYLLPADGTGKPRPLLAATTAKDAFFAPSWSPDGKLIYTSHFHRGNDTTPDRFTIDQITLDGQLKQLIPDAEWPALSPDGKEIAYVSAAPDRPNVLYLAGGDGSNPHPALPVTRFPAVDDHFYAPDGKSVIFSAVNPAQPAAQPTFLERLLGVEVVSAHNVPSDWYAVGLESGKIDRLTNLNDTGLYAALSPDQKRAAFIARSGIYVMNLDGTQLTQLNDQAVTGTVSWGK